MGPNICLWAVCDTHCSVHLPFGDAIQLAPRMPPHRLTPLFLPLRLGASGLRLWQDLSCFGNTTPFQHTNTCAMPVQGFYRKAVLSPKVWGRCWCKHCNFSIFSYPVCKMWLVMYFSYKVVTSFQLLITYKQYLDQWLIRRKLSVNVRHQCYHICIHFLLEFFFFIIIL